jgi:pimeloyl-ACP methyl ester carboxylesterase
MELLSPTWRTIACDHRGTGATLIPVESITFDALVADLFRVMDAYRGERCVVTGESAGPAVAMQAVIQRSERFEGLCLLDGTAGVQRCAGTLPGWCAGRSVLAVPPAPAATDVHRRPIPRR